MEKLPNSSGCFVCGNRNPSGLGVRFFVEGERVITRFTPAETQMGFSGITHGGVIAALLDETMGWAAAVANRRFCVTVEIGVQYLKPLPIGTESDLAGWLTAGGRRIWTTAGEIRDADGTVYARATGRYVPLSDEKTQDVVAYLNFDEGCVPVDRVCRTCGSVTG